MIGILIAILCVVIFVFMPVGYGVGIYNTLVDLSQSVKTQWSNVLTEYQRRLDLFLNLAETVKSFKHHERETLKEVIGARNSINNLKSMTPNKAAGKKLSGFDSMFSKLMLLVEQYPQLKAGEQHSKFMDEMRVTEDRINIARTDFNELVNMFNITVLQFPSSIVAKLFNFTSDEYYALDSEETKTAPRIKLD